MPKEKQRDHHMKGERCCGCCSLITKSSQTAEHGNIFDDHHRHGRKKSHGKYDLDDCDRDCDDIKYRTEHSKKERRRDQQLEVCHCCHSPLPKQTCEHGKEGDYNSFEDDHKPGRHTKRSSGKEHHNTPCHHGHRSKMQEGSGGYDKKHYPLTEKEDCPHHENRSKMPGDKKQHPHGTEHCNIPCHVHETNMQKYHGRYDDDDRGFLEDESVWGLSHSKMQVYHGGFDRKHYKQSGHHEMHDYDNRRPDPHKKEHYHRRPAEQEYNEGHHTHRRHHKQFGDLDCSLPCHETSSKMLDHHEGHDKHHFNKQTHAGKEEIDNRGHHGKTGKYASKRNECYKSRKEVCEECKRIMKCGVCDEGAAALIDLVRDSSVDRFDNYYNNYNIDWHPKRSSVLPRNPDEDCS